MPKPQRDPGRTFLTAYAELLNQRQARREARERAALEANSNSDSNTFEQIQTPARHERQSGGQQSYPLVR